MSSIEHLPPDDLRQLVDAQAEIVELIATNGSLETILVALTGQLEDGWNPTRTVAAIALSSESAEGDEVDRSVFASPTLAASSVSRSLLFPATLSAPPGNGPKGNPEPKAIDASSLSWPGLGALQGELGVARTWLVPIAGPVDGALSWLALYTPGDDDLTLTEHSLLYRYAHLASIAIEQHRGELRLHRLIAEERQRLAGVLHDDPIQAMTAVSLRVQRLARHVDSDAANLVLDLQKSITTAIDRMRRLLIDLHPPTLDNEGLVSAIDVYLAEVIEPLDIECVLDDQVVDEPSIETASLAYRLVAEALWNVAKHAQASRVTVQIRARGGAVDIRVVDDGVGFDYDQHVRSRAGHMGLSACRALSARASGSWTVSSEPGNGTTVTIRLPGELPTGALTS